MTKIEEVARAISVDLGEDPDALDVLIQGREGKRPHWEGFESTARAAIEALRRPNEAMERAGDETGCFVGSDEDVNYRGREAGAVFTAMIDAILSEGDGAKP